MSIETIGEKYKSKIINLRETIHMNPEIGFEEFQTSKLVADTLKEIGVEIIENVAKTGVVGIIRGKNPGKTILIRADMDALLVDELADVPYKSKVKGKMHACGHDGHTETFWMAKDARTLRAVSFSLN